VIQPIAAADPAHDPLHDAEMVEDRHQGREEDDHRQRAEREGVGERIGLVAAEQELRPLARIAEQVGDAAAIHSIAARPQLV
jgi:hypothetical protein